MDMDVCRQMFSSAFPFWDSISEKERFELCRYTMFSNFKKGENVHGNNAECTGAILIKSGCLRVYLLSEEGREITLYRLFQGDVCILSASCVLSSITFDVFVDAQEDSECYIIGGNKFAQLADKNIIIKNYALELAVERFSDVMWVMQQILFMSYDQRLAIFLYDEMVKNNDKVIRLTQEQIASYTGSAREVVSRMLKYFTSEGIVRSSRGGVEIINKDKLKSLIK